MQLNNAPLNALALNLGPDWIRRDEALGAEISFSLEAERAGVVVQALLGGTLGFSLSSDAALKRYPYTWRVDSLQFWRPPAERNFTRGAGRREFERLGSRDVDASTRVRVFRRVT